MSDNEEKQATENKHEDISHEEVNNAEIEKKSEDHEDGKTFKMSGHVGQMIRRINGLRDKKENQKREVKWGINRSKSYRETSLNNERDVLPPLRRQSSFSENLSQDNRQNIRHTLAKRHGFRDTPQINIPDLRQSMLGNGSDKETSDGFKHIEKNKTETQTNQNLDRSPTQSKRRNINQTKEEVQKRRYTAEETNRYYYLNATQHERQNTDAEKSKGRKYTDRETNPNLYFYRNPIQDQRRNNDKATNNCVRPKTLLDLRRSHMQEQTQIKNIEKTVQNIETVTSEPGLNYVNNAAKLENLKAEQDNTTCDNRDTNNENIKQDNYENTRDSFLSLNSFESSNQDYSGTETDDTLVISTETTLQRLFVLFMLDFMYGSSWTTSHT